ncbi:MAG: cation transporter [Deltaproteobacteria bacterium]|nr:cation transporter [Deltaproteobacteria bacterium]MBW2538048.1 cation transporter [Deltaproteobacteria bacterium]
MAHQQSHPHAHQNTRSIRFAFFLNLTFTLIEITGGIWTNSVAILSDALHDLGDSLSLGLAWYLEKYSQKEKDKKYSYGYRRFSMLGALANTIILIVGSLIILSEAIPRIIRPEQADAKGMALLAVGGILVNGIAALRVSRSKSLNARMVAWHLLEDLLGWIAVLVVSIVLLFKEIYILDPILSVLITTYVLYNVVRNLKKTLVLFMQAVPEGIDVSTLENKILAIDKIRSIHHLHVWSLDGEHHVLTTHVVIESESTIEDVQRVRKEINALMEGMDFEHTAIEVECEDEACRMKEI